MEPVEKEMKKTEKVEVTSVNVTDEQVTVKVDATKQLSATTEPSGQKTVICTVSVCFPAVAVTVALPSAKPLTRPVDVTLAYVCPSVTA
jgi:hypothetical protein